MPDVENVPVVVVGAGQAGLATGYHLARHGISFVILEAADRVGQTWRGRWASLKLFTPARFSGLPGLPFPGGRDRFPGKEEVADYLEKYATTFELPIRFGSPVTELTRNGAGYQVVTPEQTFHAGAVIVATGAFQQPRLPAAATALGPDVLSLHSSAYRDPAQLRPGSVLVVGAGNSGLQIADELANAGRETHLSVGTRSGSLPRKVLGNDIFWWLDRLLVLRAPLSTMPKVLRGGIEAEVLIGHTIEEVVRGGRITEHGRTVGASAQGVQFGDGTVLAVSNVVWATGYCPDYSWLGLDITDPETRLPVHRAGATAAPGVYFIGLPNMRTSASALLGWVGTDAGHVVSHLGRHHPQVAANDISC